MRKLEKTDANRSNNKKPFAIALEAKIVSNKHYSS